MDFWTPKFERKFAFRIILEYLLILLHARFIGSVTIDKSGDEVVIEKRFFSEHFLDFIDSIFFLIPFSRFTKADAAKGIAPPQRME